MSSNNEESLSKFYELLYLPKDASLQQIETTYQLFKEFKEGSKQQKLNTANKKLLDEHELSFCKILKFKNAEREKQFKAENQPQQKNLLIPDGMIPFVMNFGTSQLNSTNSTKLQSNVLQNRLSSAKPRNYFDIRPIPLRSPGTFKQIDVPQTNFKRINQFDIEYNENLVLKEGQTCGEMKIPLDREFLKFINENQERGNLVVRFNVVSEQEFAKKQTAKKKIAEKAPVTKHNVLVTLEEVFEGSQKSVSINRKRFDDQTGEKWIEKASFTLDIKPGTPDGEKRLFPLEGDQLADGTFTDLLFCLQTAPHPKFTRDGADLKYFVKVSESQLKNQEEILIPTLDGRTFKVKLDDEVLSGGSKKYFGHGLPYPNDTQIRGNLLVQFQIVSEEIDQVKVDLPKLKPNQCKLKLTLEEIYSGCQKRRSFFQKYTNENGKSVSKMIQLVVPVKPGSIEGTTIQMDNQGDIEDGKSQADVIFTVEEIKHSIFTRVDHDLECDLQVTKNQLENGGHFDIPTLEGKPKKIFLEGPIKENFVKKMTKFGLPFLDEPKKFGDILVKFVMKPEIKPKTKDPDIEQNLGILLEEIFTGCTKKLKINRQVLDAEGNEHFSDEVISIDVPPGCKEGHQFRFSNLGDEFPDRIPADIVFTIKYKAHSKFTPKGNDIECTEMITSEEVQLGVEIEIPSLNEPQPILQLIDKLTNIKTPLVIRNKGLPIAGNLEERGNLLVYFKTVSNKYKVPPKETVCFITIDELRQDTAKKMTIPQTVYDKRGTQIAEHLKELNFVVKKDTLPITKLTFTRFGDVKDGFIQGDLIVIVQPELGQMKKIELPLKHAPILQNVEISLKEVLTGSIKPVRIHRKAIDSNGNEFLERKLITLDVKPGTISGTKMTYPKMGHYNEFVKLPGDIIFTIKDKPNEVFTRHGADIEFIALITKLEAEYGFTRSIPSFELDGSQIHIEEDKKTLPNSIKKIPGHGLPKATNTSLRGDLIVKFKIDEKDENVPQINREFSLEDFLCGFNGEIKIPFNVIEKDRPQTIIEHFQVNLKPGTPTETKMLISRKGDKYFGQIPEKVLLVVQEKSHKLFRRNGCHIELIKNVEITSKEAQSGCQVVISTLEKTIVPLTIPQSIQNNVVLPINGYGLPYFGDASKRGNLLVTVLIVEEKKETVVLLQSPPQHFDVDVSLETVAKGGIQKMTFQRKITFENGKEEFENDKLTIDIKAGTPAGTQFAFPKKGDVHFEMLPSDVICTVRYAPHEMFKQSGVNLEYNCQINTKEAKYGAGIKIPTLYGPYFVTFTKEITNRSTLSIDNYGLPHKNDARKRGKLIVHFEVVEEIKGIQGKSTYWHGKFRAR